MEENRSVFRAREEDSSSDSEFESGTSDDDSDLDFETSENEDEEEEEEDINNIPSTSHNIKRKLPFNKLYTFHCKYPGCVFTCRTYRSLDIHVEARHNCEHCGISYPDLDNHVCTQAGQRGGHIGPVNINQDFFIEIAQSLRGIIAEYEYTAEDLFTDFPTFFNHIWDPLIRLLQEYLLHFRAITVRIRMQTELEDIRTNERKLKFMGTNAISLTHENFIGNVLHFALNFILKQLELYNSNGSGHTVSQIFNAIITIGKYKPIAARGFIPIPTCLSRRRGLLNIQGAEDFCFKYCVTANFFQDEVKEYRRRLCILRNEATVGYNYNKNMKRTVECGKNYEPFFDKFCWDGLEFPISLDAFDTFELNNAISVNCFQNEGKDILPIRLTTFVADRHVDLLRLESEDNAHYVLITDLSLFLGQRNKHKHYYCRYCLKSFVGKNVLLKHKHQCSNLEFNIMTFPKEKSYVFNNFEMTIPFPYCLYYDFETFSKPCDNNPGSKTRKLALLEPSGYSLVLVGPSNYLHVDEYHGPDVVDHFMKNVLGLAEIVFKKIKEHRLPMKPTDEELLDHEAAELCFMCRKPFTAKNWKVLHHNHMTGKIIGSLHNNCNLKIKYKNLLPCLAHNATKFDNSIILHGFKMPLIYSVDVIPKNNETFMGFIVNKKVKFFDSCQFLLHSLAKLTEDLKVEGIDKFRNTRAYFHDKSPEQFKLLISKQVYPYDYLTGPEVYTATDLPPKECFYDSLRGTPITDENYRHAQEVWKAFNCQTFEDYARLYSISDSLLLSDIFENFRATAIENRGLDPLYVWSASGFSWSCAMYSSQVELEYVKDLEILNMLQEGIRGGPTIVSNRLARANNEDLGPHHPFDPNKPRTRLVYQDLNSLYPYCMLSPLPYKDFKMMTQEELENINIESLREEDGKGYIFSVDLDYSPHLHNSHNDLPLAVEKRKIRIEEISPTQEHLIHMYNKVISKPLGGEKLVMTLYPKQNYIVYYKTLQFYIKHGLVLKKIHKGFSFSETYVFRDYIAGNLETRRNTKSKLVNELYKLLSNSIFGRTLMNSKNFFDVALCNNRQDAEKLLAKANLKSFSIINDDLTLFSMNKTEIKCNSFFYLGFTILERAKLRWYESYYEGIKSVFGSRSHICYGDTDSFVTLIDDPNNTFVQDMQKISNWYDFSNLNIDNPLYSTKNKGLPGVFKIVIPDAVEIVAISSKMYSILTVEDIMREKGIKCGENEREILKKGKGIGRSVLAKLRHHHYIDTILKQNTIFNIEMQSIRAFKCVLYRVLLKKIGFHALDTKRFLLRGGLQTLAFGHYNIEQVIRNETNLSNSFVEELNEFSVKTINV